MNHVQPDSNLIRGLLKPVTQDHVMYKWHETVSAVFFGSDYDLPDVHNIALTRDIPHELDCVDFSVPRDCFETKDGTIGLSLTNITRVLFGQSGQTHATQKVVLPEFQHVSHYDPAYVWSRIEPRVVCIQGVIPISYVLDTINGLQESARTVSVKIMCETIELSLPVHPVKRSHLIGVLQSLGKEDYILKVYVQNVTLAVPQDQDVLKAFVEASSQTLRGRLDWTKDLEMADRQDFGEDCSTFCHIGEVNTSETFSDVNAAADGGELLHNNDDDGDVSGECNDIQTEHKMILLPYVKTALNSLPPTEPLVTTKTKPLNRALLKGYDAALHLLNSCPLGDTVASLDLRMADIILDQPGSDVQSIPPPSEDFPFTFSDSGMRQAAGIHNEIRQVALSGTFRSLSVKAGPNTKIQEIVLPGLYSISDIKESFSCRIWNKVRHVYLPDYVTMVSLLDIVSSIPKSENDMTLHVQTLHLQNSLPEAGARDLDPPPGLRILVYNIHMDQDFFFMSQQTVKVFYELCLGMASVTFLQFLHDQCQRYATHSDAFRSPYNSCMSFTASASLSAYLEDALTEGHVSGQDALLNFTSDVFKYDVMTSGVGQLRYRRAFVPQVDNTPKLPRNIYREVSDITGDLIGNVRSGSLRGVTVAILGDGINAFHPEFNSKLGQGRYSGRDRDCPFAENLIGMAYNAVPMETMACFLDSKPSMGTTMAALVAGATCGAAPFASVVSLKVTNAAGMTRPSYVRGALRWLREQEDGKYLPPSDVICVPFTFARFCPELYQELIWLGTSGKVVVCSAGPPVDTPDSTILGYPAALGDALVVGKQAFWRVSGELQSRRSANILMVYMYMASI